MMSSSASLSRACSEAATLGVPSPSALLVRSLAWIEGGRADEGRGDAMRDAYSSDAI